MNNDQNPNEAWRPTGPLSQTEQDRILLEHIFGLRSYPHGAEKGLTPAEKAEWQALVAVRVMHESGKP